MVNVARRHGLEAHWSIDPITERAPGQKWNLLKKSHQDDVIKIVKAAKPGILIGSPPMFVVFKTYEH